MTGPSGLQITLILRKEKRSIQISGTPDSDTSSVLRSKRQLKKQKKTSDLQTQSIIQDVKDTRGFSTEIPVSDTTLIGVASPRNPNERWRVDPKPNLTMEREMTALMAKQ